VIATSWIVMDSQGEFQEFRLRTAGASSCIHTLHFSIGMDGTAAPDQLKYRSKDLNPPLNSWLAIPPHLGKPDLFWPRAISWGPYRIAPQTSQRSEQDACHGKVKDIYKSKELWRGSESIYTLTRGLCVAHDNAGVIGRAGLRWYQGSQ
jgi:hypothetical protein